MESIRDQVKWFIMHHILSEEDAADEIAEGTNLREAGILSSLWIVRLVSFIEERFQVNFNVTDLDEENFSSITTIERLVQTKMAEAT